MFRKFIVSLAALFLCFGCATDSGPKPTFDQGARVGIVNGVESHLTHRHITVRRINSFTRQIEVDWNISDYFDTGCRIRPVLNLIGDPA